MGRRGGVGVWRECGIFESVPIENVRNMTMKTQARLPRSNENPVDLTGSYLESTFNLLQPSHSPHPQATEGQAHGHRGIGP